MKKILQSLILSSLAVGLFFVMTSVAMAAALAPTATTYLDSNNNGQVDQIKLVFTDVTACAYEAGDWAVGIAGTINVAAVTGIANTGTCADDNFILVSVTANANTTGGAVNPRIDYTDAVTAGSLVADTNQDAANFTATDAAAPVVVSTAINTASSANTIAITYSEAMTFNTNGWYTTASGDKASDADFGEMTLAGTIDGIGAWAGGTVGNVANNAVTDNTVSLDATDKILTITFNGQTGGYFTSASTTSPAADNTFTPEADAAVLKEQAAGGLAVNVAKTVATAPTVTGAWDLTKPTITSATLADAAGNNGKLDRATVVFSTAIKDASITNGDATLGAGAGTFTTGVANDETTAFNLTADTLTADTSATGASFLYSGATTKITDLAGNLLDTATDGTIVVADVVEADGANPVILTVTLSQDGTSGRNKIVYTFSEPMYLDNTNQDGTIDAGDTTSSESIASTAAFGNIDAVGSIEQLGNFTTAGNVDESGDTANYLTFSSDGKTLTLELAYAVNSYLVSTSTTVPSGTFTADAASYFQAQAGAGVQTINTANTPTSSGSWDLTKPTISSALMTDSYLNANTSAAGYDGKVDKLVLTASETLKTVADSTDTRSDFTVTSGVTEYGNNLTVTSASASGTSYTIVFSGANIFYDTAAFTLTAAADEWSLMDRAGNILPPTSKVCMYGYICTGGTANYAVLTASITRPNAADTTPPGLPTVVTAAQTDEGKVKLTWTDPTAADLSSIVILRGKNGATITGTPYGTVGKGIKTYTDGDVAIGDKLEYILKSVDSAGNASGLTQTVSITVTEVVAEAGEEAVEEAVEGVEEAAEDEEEAVEDEEEAAEGEEEATEDEEEALEEGTSGATPTVTTVEEIVEVFTDLKDVTWAGEAVTALYNKGIVKGKSDGSFAPSDNLNRAEAAAMLYRVLGLDEPDAPSAAPFKDIEKDAWYAGYIDYLKGEDVVKGNPDGTYKPGDAINRAEFLTLVMRVYKSMASASELETIEGYEKGAKTDHYADLTDSWYTETVTVATELGIVSGSEKGGKYYFNANATINRAEAAKMLYNAFE